MYREGTVKLMDCESHKRHWAGRKLLILAATTGRFQHEMALVSLNLTLPWEVR